MPPPPSFRYTQVVENVPWSNFHHTIAQRNVPLYLTPGAASTTSLTDTASTTRQLADALSDVLAYCQTSGQALCVPGATWSLSNVLDPQCVLLDQGAYNKVVPVPPAWLTPAYVADAKPRKGTPYLVQGGAQIRSIHEVLGQSGLALQTSGANDGHRLAGAIATGTHGSALDIGALHDTVLGVYLVTGPGTAVFVQPTQRGFAPELAHTLGVNTGLATTEVCDDAAYGAALVGLGALGFVHSVIVEAVPLYEFTGALIARPLNDADVWEAMRTLDTSAFEKQGRPYHFSVVLSPYAQPHEPGAFVTLLWKREPTRPYAPPDPATMAAGTDTTLLLSRLVKLFGDVVTAPIFGAVIAGQTSALYKPGPIGPLFPGQMFGPTNLPPGNGRSIEIVVDHADAITALNTVLVTIANQESQGRLLLGAIGVRFVRKTRALLGMNARAMNCYIELPSLNSTTVGDVYRACWDALTKAGVAYTCHWGQEYGMTAASVGAYFGDRVARWKAARASLLAEPARRVFTNPLVTALGLV